MEVLYSTQDAIEVLDPNVYVMALLQDKDTVYFGKAHENQTCIDLRKYQQEALDAAMRENR